MPEFFPGAGLREDNFGEALGGEAGVLFLGCIEDQFRCGAGLEEGSGGEEGVQLCSLCSDPDGRVYC
jgi:hypothetical protein